MLKREGEGERDHFSDHVMEMRNGTLESGFLKICRIIQIYNNLKKT